MKSVAFITMAIILIMCACQSEKDTASSKDYEKISVVDSLVIQLDSLSVPVMSNLQVGKYFGTDVLFNLNNVDSSIYGYDLSTGIKKVKVKFNGTGSKRLNKVASVLNINENLYLYLDVLLKFSLVDSSLNVIKKFDPKNDSIHTSPLFINNWLPPIEIDSGTFFMPNYFVNEYGKKIGITIDFKTGQVQYHIDVPSEFLDGFLGVLDYKYWNYTFNNKDSTIVFAFPNLDSVYLYDLSFNLLNKKRLGSKEQTEKIPKLHDFKDMKLLIQQNIPQEQMVNNIKRRFLYHEVFYNESKNQYYRIVGLPISEENINSVSLIKSSIRNYNLIVADSEFSAQKEYKIPFNKYYIPENGFFIYNGFLYLQRIVDNEDMVIFDIVDTT